MFKYPISKNGKLIIAINSNTQELYLPSKEEFNYDSNFVHMYMNNFIDDIINKELSKQYKKKMNLVIEELKKFFKSKMKLVFKELIEKKERKEFENKMNVVLFELKEKDFYPSKSSTFELPQSTLDFLSNNNYSVQ